MLLLWLVAGVQLPSSDGVIAYATTTFGVVTGSAAALTTVTLAQSDTTPRTGAQTTEE